MTSADVFFLFKRRINMNNLTDWLYFIGLNNQSNNCVLSSQTEDYATNYLNEGNRILSLAKEKKQRILFKSNNLTVRLCDFKYPIMNTNNNINRIAIIKTITRELQKAFKESVAMTEECIINQCIPFLLRFCSECSDFSIELTPAGFEQTLAKAVTKSEHVISLSVGEQSFYIPCKNHKRFRDSNYHYTRNPNNSISMLHLDTAFINLFGIAWLNQLKKDSHLDSNIASTLKQLSEIMYTPVKSYKWRATTAPASLSNYLLNVGFYLDSDTGYYITSNMHSETLCKDYNESSDLHFQLKLIEFTHGDIFLSAKDLIDKSLEYTRFYLPSCYDYFVFSSLKFYISATQDIKEEEKHRKRLEGEVARAYTTKKNIPKKILKKMQTSTLNYYFGFVEFDEDVDLFLVDSIIKEFQKLNTNIFSDFISKEVSLRFRKLGRHHASGLYYPSINTIVVDFRYPSSFIHEYFHMLDDYLGNLSLQYEFEKIVVHYQKLVETILKKENKKGHEILSSTGKYNINYYLRRCEIFARCGEIHLSRNLNVVSSLLKPEETKSFAYPEDDLLNKLVDDYYSNVINSLSNFKKREENNL